MTPQKIFMDASQKEKFLSLLEEFNSLKDDNGKQNNITMKTLSESTYFNKNYNPYSYTKTKEYVKCVTAIFDGVEFEVFLRKLNFKFHYDVGQLFFY